MTCAWRCACALWVSAAWFFFAAAAAQAQEGFALARFHPTSSQRTGYLTVESAQTLPPQGFEVGLLFDFADDPFVARLDGERILSRSTPNS
jgi:hypothetical protein